MQKIKGNFCLFKNLVNIPPMSFEKQSFKIYSNLNKNKEKLRQQEGGSFIIKGLVVTTEKRKYVT